MGEISCVECPACTDEFERGWRARLADGEWETVFDVVIFCPECAHREFGERRTARSDEPD